MSPIKRFLTAFIFYPLLIVWFIPKEAFKAIRKAKRISGGDLKQAKAFFVQEFKVAMASRSRKPLGYDYFTEEIAVIKRINKEQNEAIIDKELGVTTDVEATGRPRE